MFDTLKHNYDDTNVPHAWPQSSPLSQHSIGQALRRTNLNPSLLHSNSSQIIHETLPELLPERSTALSNANGSEGNSAQSITRQQRSNLPEHKHRSNGSRGQRGPMDDMRQLVRKVHAVLPDITESFCKDLNYKAMHQIMDFFKDLSSMINGLPIPTWGVPEGQSGFLSRLLTLVCGKPVSEEDALLCFIYVNRHWEVNTQAATNLGLLPCNSWPVRPFLYQEGARQEDEDDGLQLNVAALRAGRNWEHDCRVTLDPIDIIETHEKGQNTTRDLHDHQKGALQCKKTRVAARVSATKRRRPAALATAQPQQLMNQALCSPMPSRTCGDNDTSSQGAWINLETISMMSLEEINSYMLIFVKELQGRGVIV
ncbi:hypothetical protein CEUSTIGMA_g420.t1 [Chlamydomonas eustigma]|uniref:Uncharacterized protein n=1 Tax=Chlamydomonas eustigma TaxID=1157962 RepID=A0A250WQJ3_9CHLO|nr:hypothetical protein CEUSTIGMA_g420.t1 [Chlamydomonas eustigma]|eukprot:GAX72966.1 hypothetical protein CEUSTIGMA_g420.t1 [Chlamydomonas eustigma]